MDKRDLILADKEIIYNIIDKYHKYYQLVTLKANIPGIIKNTKESKILLTYFDSKISKFKVENKIYHKGESGDTIIYLFSLKENMKNSMVKLERMPLGRFVDIDCYFYNKESIKRKKLRKCYICSKPAFYCIRNNAHKVDELKEYIEKEVHGYIRKVINKCLFIGFTKELYLYPKFGLVSVLSSGSHKDMNYKLMAKSRDVIIPYLLDMFDIGYYNEIDNMLKPIRILGKAAEKCMLDVTGGVNTYKGLIFGLGIVTSSLGYYLTHDTNKTLREVIIVVSKPILNDFTNNPNNTYGLESFNSYGIMGARGNAINGYEVVFDLLKNNNLSTKDDLYRALFNFVYYIDDTVLLKRAGSYDKYIEIKDLFKEYDRSLVKPLTKYSIKNNLSFGGSADLLSISIFLKEVMKKLELNSEFLEGVQK